MPAVKSKFLVPAIGTAVVVGGGAAAYLYLRGVTGDAFSPVASARVVPQAAVMAAFISTDDKAWSQLQKFGTPEAQKLVEQNFKDFQSRMLAETSVNFEQDLKPWVGSLMFAFLPPDAGTKSEDPNLLMVVGIKDKGKAFNFAQKLKSQKAATTKESNYQGVSIAEISEQPGKNYSVAVLDNHLVLSPQRQVVEGAIDTFKGKPSFASKTGGNNIFSQKIDLQNPIAQVYLPDYAAAVQQLAANGSAPIPSANLQRLKQIKSVVMGMGVDDSGLRLKAITKLDSQAAAVEYKPVPGKVAAQFPTQTIALVGGQGLKTVWTAMANQAKTDPASQSIVTLIRQQLKVVNLDADQDVFGWMDGEFALGAIASNQGMLAQTGFGGAIVLQTSDRKTAEATLTKLDTLAKTYSVNVSQRDVQGKSVTEWKMFPTEPLIGHGWLDQNSLFIAIGGPLIEVMASKPQNTLEGTATYKSATSSLAKSSMGYLYLDMDKMMALLNSPPFRGQAQAIPPETAAVLNSIQGIGMTATQPEKLTNQFDVLLALKPRTAQ